ncbi:MAG TPA: (2Fe-2S)-binding protein [Alphaproteobacteria bacterium]|jgi:bacterioferritin-associated ferredoxin
MSQTTNYLCWCNGISAETFTAAIRANPRADLYEIARSVNLGTKCTSCLADVEDLYISLFQSAERPDMRVPRDERLPLRRRLWRFIDRLSPKVNVSVRHLAPVIRAPGVRTVVSLANSVAKKIGPVSAQADVSVAVRDAGGAVRHRFETRLRPGERTDVVASDHLAGAESIGTACVSILPRGGGVTGTLRPHFRVECRAAAGSVHTQGATGALSAFHLTPRGAPGERQSVFLMNCTGRRNVAKAVFTPHGGPSRQAAVPLAPNGAAWWHLPADGADHTELREVVIVGERNFKSYFVVGTAGFDRISLDHL